MTTLFFKKPISKYTGSIANPTLKIGNKGTKVKNLQKFLNWYLNDKLEVDGDFGKKTEKALKKFQKYENLVKDGIYGPKSYEKAKKYKKIETNNTPSVEEVKIIDVSYWQHTINWKKVKNDGIYGAILRASYTSQNSFTLSTDSTFATNLKEAINNDLPVGAYHYSQAISVDEAKKEAEYICRVLEKYKSFITLPVVCDWEFGRRLNSKKARSLGKDKCTEIINTFCKVIKSNGFIPMVYANYSTFNSYLDVDTFKKNNYFIWLAQYANNPSMKYDMWQYTSGGSVSGINGRVDMNKAKVSIFEYNN